MPGLKDFTTQTFHPRTIVTKAANYTVTLSDELVRVNGAYTMTLPVLSTMQGSTTHRKVLRFDNIHATADATITAGSGNTINSKASWVVKAGDSIVISAQEVDTNWAIISPSTTPALLKHSFNAVVTTSGTTPVNIFDASGAPANITVSAIQVMATVTLAGNVTVKNGTTTVLAIAKSTTIGALTGNAPSGNAVVSSGSVFTAESDGGDAVVVVLGHTQSYA